MERKQSTLCSSPVSTNLSILEIFRLKEELSILKGQFLQNAYSLGEEDFALKFNRHVAVFKPKKWAFLMDKDEFKGGEAKGKVVQKIRSEFRNAKVISVEVFKKDRALMIEFTSGKIIVDFMPKGGVHIITKEGVFSTSTFNEEAYRPFSTDRIDEFIGREKVGKAIGKLVGRKYSELAVEWLNLNKESILEEKEAMKIKEFLNGLLKGKICLCPSGEFYLSPYCYWAGSKEVSSLSEVLKNIKEEVEDKELKRLEKSKEDIMKRIEEWEKDAEIYRKIGDWLYIHYKKVEELLERGKKALKDKAEKEKLEKEGIRLLEKEKAIEWEIDL